MIFTLLLVVELSASLFFAQRWVRSWQHQAAAPGEDQPARDWSTVLQKYTAPNLPPKPWREPAIDAGPSGEHPVRPNRDAGNVKAPVRLRDGEMQRWWGQLRNLQPQGSSPSLGSGELPFPQGRGPQPYGRRDAMMN